MIIKDDEYNIESKSDGDGYWVPVDNFLEIALVAMQEIAEELGF